MSVLLCSSLQAQLYITSTGLVFGQNFNGMGTTANSNTASTLPTGFRVSTGTDWSAGTSATTAAAGTSGTGVIASNSAGGTYNFAQGAMTSSTDRALGFLSSSTFTSPRSIILQMTNSTGVTINQLDITFDYEKYRSGTRQVNWTFFHGSASAPATAEPAGNQTYAANANNTTVSNPPTTISKSFSLTGLTIPDGGNYYLRWTYTGLAGSTNTQPIGIDNFTVLAIQDTDGDGVPDDIDPCPLLANLAPGNGCDDGFSYTTNDLVSGACVCAGVAANDDCVSSIYLGGAQAYGSCPAGATTGTTIGATASGGGCGASSNDVWYYFSASNGSYSFVDLAPGNASGMGIEVFDWDGCVNTSSVYCAAGNSHTVPTAAGQTYAVRVYTTTPGNFTLCVSAPQPNDDCANATNIGNYDPADCPANATTGTTLGATPSGGSCATSANDVWYYFYSNSSLFSNISLAVGSASGLGIEVFSASCGGTSIYCASGTSHTVPVTPNQYYYMRVFSTTPGDFTVCVSNIVQPGNDECAGSTYLGGAQAFGSCTPTDGTTIGASASGGGCSATANDVWYYVYASSSASTFVDLVPGTASGMGIEVFLYDGCVSPTSIYCASGNNHTVAMTPGVLHTIRVFTTSPGSFSICVSAPQPNDDCANATNIGNYDPADCPTNASTGTTLGATPSGGSCGASNKDVWYYFYSNTSLFSNVSLAAGTASGLGIEVFSTSCGGTSIYCASGTSHAVPVIPAQYYYMRVFSTTPGDFSVCVSNIVQPSNDECAGSTYLGGAQAFGSCTSTAGTTIGASASGGGCSATANDVWYYVYASSSANTFVDLLPGTAAGMGIEVFLYDGCVSPTSIYCASGNNHVVAMSPSQLYGIRVFTATSGTFSICVSAPPANDDCANATGLGLYNYGDCPANATAGTTVGATQSGANSCNGGASQDVWYTVYTSNNTAIFCNLTAGTASGLGIEVFDACGGNVVYCGTGLNHTVPVQPNVSYYIKVSSTTAGDFGICASQPVFNNECAYATSLGTQAYADCPANATAGTTVGATQSGSNSCNGSATLDVWYYAYSYSGSSLFVDLSNVTAAGIGIEVFDACGGNLVYCASGTSHTVPTALSTCYYIKVFSTSPGTFSICASTPVANNECAYATSLGTQAFADCPANATAGTTVGATQSGANSCNGSATLDVWYYAYSYSGSSLFVDLSNVTAAGIGIVVFDACGGNLVYCASATSHTVPTVLSTYYYIKVFSTSPGGFSICTSTPVANNECPYAVGLGINNNGDCPANATASTTLGSTASGTNPCNGSASFDVWHSFYVGASASVVINLSASGAGGLGVQVFDGCPGTSIYCASGTTHTVAVTPFQTYYAKVFSTSAGGFDICVNYPPPVLDCLGILGGSALPGTACDDSNACTTGDTWNNGCQCIATPLPDGDGDGVCDAQDNCPTVIGQVGSGCDDGNPCTTSDALNGGCVCVGTPGTDSDGDGTCDSLDPCPYLANLNNGDPCDDGNAGTIGDVVSGCACGGTVSSGGISLQANWPHVNGTVRALSHDAVNDIVYFGGSFSRVGPEEPFGAKVNTSNGSVDYLFPNPNGSVEVAVPDGAGGWYIGGYFTKIGGVVRNRVARINADGSLHAWNPNANFGVEAIVVAGSTVYLGGSFSSIGGQPRVFLAAVNSTTGVPTSWNPGATGSTVLSLALNGTTLYVGGFLNSLGGTARTNAGALNTVTGSATAWNPAPNNAIMSMVVSGGVVFAGGQFTTIGGESRTALAALNATSGVATSWNPSVAGAGSFASVNALSLYSGDLLVGGQFVQIGGASRDGLARLSTTTALATAWDPDVNGGGVLAMSVFGTSAYVVGNITTVAGQLRKNAAEVDLVGGGVSAWDPAPASTLNTVCRSGSAVFIGGTFTIIGGTVRNNLAAINGTTGEILPWDPDIQHPVSPDVYDVHLSGDSLLYAAGQFNSVGSDARFNLTAIRTSNGTATNWAPDANLLALTVLRDGGDVYVGGAFSSVGGQLRDRIACLNAATGAATTWNPGANSNVIDLALKGDTLFAGGIFSTIGGVPRSRLAAVSRSSASTLAWSADVAGLVMDLAMQGDRLYVAGEFTSIGGQPRNHLALLDRVSGAVSPWNPNPTSQTRSVDGHGSGVYIGGGFSNLGGQPRQFLGSVGTFTGTASGWNPQPSGGSSGIEALLVSGDRLFVCGDFKSMSLQPRAGIAAFTLPSTNTAGLNAKAHLEGPYNSTTGLMGDAVRSAGLVPVSEPYTGLGYAHTGGGGSEFTTPTVLGVTGNNAIVDWVLLELRDNANSSSIVATRAALVQRDGDIVDVDGVSAVTFNVAPGNYYVAVRHRNHLGCMTATAVSLSAAPATVNYTTLATATFGTAARKTSGGAVSVQLLWAGDVTFNGQIKYTGSGNDRDPVLTTVGSTTPNNTVLNTYSTRDVNLNGQVKYTGTGNDRDPILVNVGSTTPNNIRLQQLP